MVLRELVTILGFDVDFEPLNQFDEKIVETKASITDLGAAADDSLKQIKSALTAARNYMIGFSLATVGGAAALFAFAKSSANAGDEISKTAPMLGFTAEEYQKYRYAAELAGVENESFVQSTQMLLNHVGEIRAGNLATAVSFNKVGLSVGALRKMKTADIYRQLATGLEKIPDQATRIQVSMDLLGRSGARMGSFLAKGTNNLDAMMADVEAFGMFSKESAEAASAFNDSFSRVAFFIRGIKNEIGAGFMPVFRGMLDDIREWLSLHRDVIKTRIDQFIRIAGAALSRAWEATKSLVHGFETMIKALGGLNNALWILAISIVAPFMLVLGPLFLVFKAITFLFLPFLRLHTLLALITFAVGSMIQLWHLLLGVVGALIATEVYSYLIKMAGGYRVLAMNMIVATAEFVAQAAALAIIILLFEDLTQWIMGNKSLIGEWIGTWQDLPNKFKKIWAEIKEIFRAGGAFMAAVFKGDFKEAYRQLQLGNEVAGGLGAGHAKSVNEGLEEAFNNPNAQAGAGGYGASAPYGGFGAYAGMPSANGPIYGYTGGKSKTAPGIGSFVKSYTMVGGQDGPELVDNNRTSAAPRTVNHNAIKVDVNLTLPKGTPEDHAQKVMEVVDERLRQHIDHSLAQSTAPGG